jgi:Flp pilus assembly protein TadD
VTKRSLLFPALAAASLLWGCSSSRAPQSTRPAEYRTIPQEAGGDATVASQENARAAEYIDQGKLGDAESALKKALTADVMHGPAHNNLGKVYFQQGKFYLAAWEFQYAAKLMPNRPEPLNNLGLVFEAVGKLDDAVTNYSKALATEPDNAEFIGNAARARLRRGDRDEQVKNLLSDLVLKDTRPEWVAWAREKLATWKGSPTGPETGAQQTR